MSDLPNLAELCIVALRAWGKGVIVVIQRDKLSAVLALVCPLAGFFSGCWHS